MMPPEQRASVSCDDTSLALPSDDTLRSGQRRVRDQVTSIKRNKSKKGGAGSPSPTGLAPQTTTTSEFGVFKFNPSKANGTFNRAATTIMASGYNRGASAQRSRTISSKAMGSRNVSGSSTWEQQFNASNWPQTPNGMTPSRSDPALARSLSTGPGVGTGVVMRAQAQNFQSQSQSQSQSFSQSKTVKRTSTYSMSNGTQMTSSQTRIPQQPSAQSQTEGRMGTLKASKSELQSMLNSTVSMSDMTIKEAVEFLSHPEENYQQCGATYIQHVTYKEDRAKREVYQLGGIPALVTLLRSSNPAVSQAAAGALRNLVFKDLDNKLEVQHCSGIAKSLQLLKETDSTETQKQVTGLLWNLSSADRLKEELIATALPALTENVVLPFTCWSDNSANNNIHPDVFYNATGCLRNLSCAKQKERTAMRECPGLVDSLMSYMESCVAEENPDDKSVENCACILHNLTYQLESESPECFKSFQPKTQSENGNAKNSPIGCFSPKSNKAQKEFTFDVAKGMLQDSVPSGVNWLCHPKAMQTYLSLLGTSQKDATLEACCGALQNLTAPKGPGASAMSQILVQKLGALSHMTHLLKSPNQALQKTAMSLLGNLSRNSSLKPLMAKQMLPELTNLLASNPREMGNSDETIASTCNTVRNLIMSNPEVSKKVITDELVTSLADLSENGSFPKGSKAASLLLYSLWNDKTLQGTIKKLGMSKSLFVNDNTTAVHRSVQVVD